MWGIECCNTNFNLLAFLKKILNQAIKRNIARFPNEFMFQLSVEEFSNLRSQFVTSSSGGRRYMPFAFTEHGTVMLASVLRSKQAIQISIEIVKAFVKMRQALTSHHDMLKNLSEIRTFMMKQSNKTNQEFRKVWAAIDEMAKPQKQIGFDLD